MKIVNVVNIPKNELEEEFREEYQINCGLCDNYEEETKAMYKATLSSAVEFYVCQECISKLQQTVNALPAPVAKIINADEARI